MILNLIRTQSRMLYLYPWPLEPFQARRFHLDMGSVPSLYSCLPCLLRRSVLSTQSFRKMEKMAMPTAMLRIYQPTCVISRWCGMEGLTREQQLQTGLASNSRKRA